MERTIASDTVSGGTQVRTAGRRPADTSRRPAKRGKTHALASWWWAAPALILVGLIIYLADGTGALRSFTDWDGISTARWIGFKNYSTAFSSRPARTALFNTLILAACFLVLTNVMGMLAALALNRTLKSRHFLRVVLFMPVVLSPLAVSYVWKFIFDQQGPLNYVLNAVGLGSWIHTWLADPDFALWTILIVMVWQFMGLAMVIYLAGLANVPVEIEEAAIVDGANTFRRFFNVTLPLLRSTVVIVSTLLLTRGLSVFDQVLGMTGGGPYGATETLATLVYHQTFVVGHYGYGAALSVLLTLLIAVLAIIQIFALRGQEN